MRICLVKSDTPPTCSMAKQSKMRSASEKNAQLLRKCFYGHLRRKETECHESTKQCPDKRGTAAAILMRSWYGYDSWHITWMIRSCYVLEDAQLQWYWRKCITAALKSQPYVRPKRGHKKRRCSANVVLFARSI
jgi:hypothetical protein